MKRLARYLWQHPRGLLSLLLAAALAAGTFAVTWSQGAPGMAIALACAINGTLGAAMVLLITGG